MPSLYTNRGAKRAREAREQLGFERDGPLPDLLHALEDRGGVHALVLALPEGVAGAYLSRPGRALLLVNGAQPLSRQRFTLAHEFGHHRLGHGTTVDRERAISGWDRDPNEVCANAFAAEFLMPREAITAWGRRRPGRAVGLEDVVLLADEYGVSAQAARYALEGAGFLDDARRRNALDEEIAEGMHLELAQRLGLEPLRDELADAATRLPRIPRTLRDTALGDLLAGQIDAAGLAGRIGRSQAETSAMLTELHLDELLPS